MYLNILLAGELIEPMCLGWVGGLDSMLKGRAPQVLMGRGSPEDLVRMQIPVQQAGGRAWASAFHQAPRQLQQRSFGRKALGPLSKVPGPS